MYIKKVVLEHIGCFDRLEINLSPRQDVGNWLLLLGDNGAGKTTVLRSIALGLCPESGVSALLSELYGEIIRYQSEDEKGSIHIEFSEKMNSIPISITTRIQKNESGDYDVAQEKHPKSNFPWSNIFVCGYGAHKGGYAMKPFNDYSSVDSVYTLFNYDASLQSPELTLRRIEPEKQKMVYEIIENIMMRPSGSIQLSNSGFISHAEDANDIPAGGWADGHRVTLNWIMDLIGWANMHNDSALLAGISGIVIMDEIEQHLHPVWQRRIIKLLNERFPKIQFIASTHASLCVIGTTDLEDDECDLLVLNKVGDVSKGVTVKPMRGKRADQILTSKLFGVDSIRSDDVSTRILRYSKLKAIEKPSKKEKKELLELSSYLNSTLGQDETELQILVRDAIDKTLNEMTKNVDIKSKIQDNDVMNFELKRQLKELFSVK